MWFLETETALRLLGAGAVWAIFALLAAKLGFSGKLNRWLLPVDILLLSLISLRLTAFYLLYTLAVWALGLIVGGVRGDAEKPAGAGAKLTFVLACLLCALPFFYLRAQEVFSALPLLFALTGFAYNMLKAVDSLYYVYYTGERIGLIDLAGYLLFFPTFTAGPILRCRDFLRDLRSPRPVTGETLFFSVRRVIIGYFKKVVVLAFVSILLSRMAALTPHFWLSLLTCLVSYLLLWLDMSGYADIAIGLGGAMGFSVPENFKEPLRAASFTQFWRNWHVSLTDWIREHIFVVLNGKKLTKYQGAAMGFITMMVMNFWHGLSLTYLADGFLMGTMLALEHLLGITTVNKKKVSRGYFFLRCVIVTLLFGFDTIFYTLTPEELRNVLLGFIRL